MILWKIWLLHYVNTNKAPSLNSNLDVWYYIFNMRGHFLCKMNDLVSVKASFVEENETDTFCCEERRRDKQLLLCFIIPLFY